MPTKPIYTDQVTVNSAGETIIARRDPETGKNLGIKIIPPPGIDPSKLPIAPRHDHYDDFQKIIAAQQSGRKHWRQKRYLDIEFKLSDGFVYKRIIFDQETGFVSGQVIADLDSPYPVPGVAGID